MSDRGQSKRLQENGYYTPEGKRTVHYYEAPNRKKGGTRRRTNTQLSTTERIANISLICATCMILLYTVTSALMPEHPDKGPSPLVSHDGVILRSHSSQTYRPTCSLMALMDWWKPKDKWVIENTKPVLGHCWPFQGSRGHLHIQLSKATLITDITLGHVTKDQAPAGALTSAPRLVSVHAMEELDGPKTFLGLFEYKKDGPGMQTFAIHPARQGTFKHVRINVESNWGHPEYTCLYHVGLHGTPPPPASS